MPVARHLAVAPGAELANAGQAHSPSHETVEGVALYSHELGKTLGATEEASFGDEINLCRCLLASEP